MARKKTFTEEELYQATQDLMLEVGYDTFSFQLLAQELDITRTALYKHYSNKNELLQAYLNHQMERVVARIETTEWSEEYAERLTTLLDLIFDYADTHAISAMVPTRQWTKENADDPDIIRSKELHRNFFGFIQQVIEEGKEQDFLNPEIPSMVMIEAIFHSINLPNRAGLPAEEQAYYVKKMLFEGILKT